MKFILALMLICSILLSHSGRTDSNGGHYNRSTGSYHYHGGGYIKPSYSMDNVSENYECGKKRYCYEMTSCNEVRYYFKTCGLSKLDGDKDGIPCEKLCR
jgi:hypothetical protein